MHKGTPGTNTEGRAKEVSNEPLGGIEETKYRALVARANYLAPDRSDIAFSVKELAGATAQPKGGDWMRRKRLGRYFAGRP